jgi:hypothetical protein
MNDGRNFAAWQPGAVINNTIRKEQNINNNWDYRLYLTNNAKSIIETNKLNACNECCACPGIYNTGKATPNVPFLYKSCLDKSQPYGYQNSDLKSAYLSRTELQQRLSAPILSQEQHLHNKQPNHN